MAEIGEIGAAVSASEAKGEGAVNSANEDSTTQSAPASTPPITANSGSTQQLPTVSPPINGASNGLTSEQRRKLIAEVEQQRTEQRRLQLIESQKRAEAQREKQREERKRRIEETRQREEARQRRAHETKKEIERQYKDHMQTLLQRNRDRTTNVSEPLRQAPNTRAPHIPSKSTTVVSSANGDRMATSFTVAFGSSAPRSICTRANEAVLRSQAAFEARLASYLSGRHSGCFLTQSSSYTSYALYVKPDLLPEDHPIRKHHQQLLLEYHSALNTPRRAVSANPAMRTARKTTSIGSGGGVFMSISPFHHHPHFLAPNRVVDEGRGRAASAVRQQPLQHHRSRPTERQVAGLASLPPLRRATSSQHFAEPTIAYASKVRGAPLPDPAVPAACKVDAPRSDDAPLKRRIVPGRSNVPSLRAAVYVDDAVSMPHLSNTHTVILALVLNGVNHLGVARDRCNSYAAPTTASMNRQRAPSHDQKPTSGEDRNGMTTSTTLPCRRPSIPISLTTAGQGRGRSRAREPTTAKTRPTEASAMKPALTKPLKPLPIKKPPSLGEECTVELVEKSKEADQAKPIDSSPKSPPSTGPLEVSVPAQEPVTILQDLKTEPSPSVETQPELDLAAVSRPAIEASTFADDVEKTPQLSSTEVSESASEKTEAENSTKEREEGRANSVEVEEEKNEVAVQEANATESDIAEADHEAAQEAAFSGDIMEGGTVQEKLQKPTLPFTSGPITASTTGSGEGGCLPEEEAAIYRAKMAEQRRLAKERLAEQERREAEEERERKERREAERQAAIQAARERAVEEARLAAEARHAREAAEQEARLHAEREAQERAAKERQRLEAIERERLENFRKAEEERAMRKKRLDSIMSRVNRSDRSLSRGVTSSESSNSLSGIASSGVPNVITSTEGEAKGTVQFSLGPTNPEQLNVFQRESADLPSVPNQNGFPKTSGSHFTSPLLQSLFSGGGRLTGAFTHTTTNTTTISPSSPALTGDTVLSENSPTTNVRSFHAAVSHARVFLPSSFPLFPRLPSANRLNRLECDFFAM
ncbi:unnamed protein product [Taenia asiatica]|uniref:Ensconsin n=1 Tax=Taenia asiatica TaxID=60517 RepID=A0A158RA31_TAEAS|nr:unnamed protein product [Taenia asiatica]